MPMMSQAAPQPALIAAASLHCPVFGNTGSTPSCVGGDMLTQTSMFEEVLDVKTPFPDILVNTRRASELLPNPEFVL